MMIVAGGFLKGRQLVGSEPLSPAIEVYVAGYQSTSRRGSGSVDQGRAVGRLEMKARSPARSSQSTGNKLPDTVITH
ncbi:hypothetical protein U1Q18_022091 [Sarracenia purpurea var. burkii]